MTLGRKLLTPALLSSLAAIPGGPAAAETPRDTFVMAMAIDAINTLDPGRLGEAVGDEVMNNICDAIVLLDTSTDSKVVPGLAESWTVSEDGMTITFKLRDTKHPSGNAVTASDAVWTFNRTLAINTINAGTLREYGLGADRAAEAFTAPDDRTLVIKLNKPYPTNFILANIFATRAVGVPLQLVPRPQTQAGLMPRRRYALTPLHTPAPRDASDAAGAIDVGHALLWRLR